MGGLFGAMSSGLRATRDISDDRYFGGVDGLNATGRVTSETVACASAVLPCVGLIAETIGSLPLEFPRRDGDQVGAAFPFADAFAYQPNPIMSGGEFWSTVAFNAVLRGRSFAEPVVHGPEDVELWPLRPTQLADRSGERTFGVDYWYEDGRSRHFRAGELLTCSGLSSDGVFAIVPWKTAQAAIELANTLEAFGHRFFRNGARPSGVLSTDQKLSPEAIARLGVEFNGNFAGVLNAGKVPILEQSLTYQAITASNTDSQYLEIRRNQIREIARNWRIPLHMLGEGDASKKNEEQQALEFVKYTLRPWLRRIEQAIGRDLMTPDQRLQFKVKFNLDALLRGDSATQWRNAVLARTASLASIDELRTNWFGLPAIGTDWSQDQREPLNTNRAADTADGGMTAPQDRSDA
jgi:HK97 family phage portal protein